MIDILLILAMLFCVVMMARVQLVGNYRQKLMVIIP